MNFWDRFRPYPELRVGIVNLKSGAAFRGVIWRRRGPFVVLRNTEILRDATRDATRSAATSLDGEVLVQMVDIDFIQVV